MAELATTPQPPYYAVIFSSQRTADDNGYADMATRMLELAVKQPGFLAQRRGRDQWYSAFRVRVAKVERDYGV